MLSIKESGLLFRLLKISSSAYLFPFVIDPKTGKLANLSERKKWIWILLYAIVLTHYAHGLIQFILLLTLRQDQIVLFHLPPQFDGLIVPLFFHPVILSTYHAYGNMIVMVFNELYDKSSEEKLKRPPWKMSIQELLGRFGAVVVAYGCTALYTTMVIFLDDMAHLLMNNPWLSFLKSSTALVMFAILSEAWSAAMWVFNACFFLSLNCLIPSKVEALLSRIHALLGYVN